MMKKILSILLVLMLLPVCSLAEAWECPTCGSTDNTGNFCGDCGAAKPSETWVCSQCGTENQKEFCTNCGVAKTEQDATTASYAVGDIITFGSYEQDGNESNGTEPISWRVLDDYGDGTYLLMSEYGLEAKAYNAIYDDVSWESCSLREWLNGDFISSAFTEEERAKLVAVTNSNPDNPDYGTEGGNDTQDTVWLLSIDEVSKYFSSVDARDARICFPTQAAKNNRADTNRAGACWWWLRSPGFSAGRAAYVDGRGFVQSKGLLVDFDSACVRPAVVLQLTDENTDKPTSETEIVTSAEHSVGDIVTFGSYEQDGDESNGAEPITWRVLDDYGDGTYLLLSEYGLEVKAYNDEDVDVTWETCTLRSWLNGEFLNSAFTEGERAKLVTVTNSNPDNPDYGTEGGNDTEDTVWLLSLDEVNMYFFCDDARICYPTQTAKNNGAYTNDAGACWWWLRSTGYDSSNAADVTGDGFVRSAGGHVDYRRSCVRPVVVLQLTGETAVESELTAEKMYEIGDQYYYGNGVERNFETAVKWYTKAAEQGNAQAQCNLGYMYECGNGVEQSYEKAVEWYTKSAEQGDALAQCNLGNMYYEGNGVEQSYKKTVEWYSKAAEQGYAAAQNDLGYMYENGYGVEQSYEKAAEWYSKAAEQGLAGAQYNSGRMYEDGYGVERSYEKAVEWYFKAAEQGFARAQSNLGYMYENGLGVEKSYEKAVEWYTKAAEQGYSDAQDALKRFQK